MIRSVLKGAARTVVSHWPDYTRLMPLTEGAQWVIDEEMREVGRVARSLGIRVVSPRWLGCSSRQCVFYGSHFFLLGGDWRLHDHRIATAYFHGRPGSGVEEFDVVYKRLCESHPRIGRVQVSHAQMREVVLASGIAKEKVFLIPIGINLEHFQRFPADVRLKTRRELGVPESAFVVGSFQKDGVGWGDGMDPKLIKGPDVFLRTLEALKPRIPELWVLLSGPARGYVKQGLERLGIPYRHRYLKRYADIGKLYRALDVYLVTSRQEGGPKAVLESLASGVPLVTTAVGQALDLVRHRENAWMTPVEDVEGLAHWTQWIHEHPSDVERTRPEGLRTAEENTYDKQIPLWKNFFDGFVSARA